MADIILLLLVDVNDWIDVYRDVDFFVEAGMRNDWSVITDYSGIEYDAFRLGLSMVNIETKECTITNNNEYPADFMSMQISAI